MSETTVTICSLLVLLLPCTIAGIALNNTGLSRSRHAAHTLLTSLCVAALAMLVYFAWGYAVGSAAGEPAWTFTAGGKTWNWLGAGPLFLHGLSTELQAKLPAQSAVVMFQIFAVGLTAVIPVSSGAERWRLAASCASTVILAGWIYPLFAHWVWGGGWLAQLGTNFGLAHGFVDPGGSSCIHVVAGLTALSISWIIGPRQGRFTSEGMPTAMPGHNMVVVLFGCMLALTGWLALNSAGALLFGGAEIGGLIIVSINTVLCAAASGLAALLTTRIRFGRPDASLTANGCLGGLVASIATALFASPAQPVLIGAVAGMLIIFAIEIVELRMKVDDPAGAVSIHTVGGIWGVLAAGMFGSIAGSEQFLAQLTGAATLIGFVLPLAYSLNWALNAVLPHRVAREGERQGMDLYELGAGAYPEFVIHREDFINRRF
jgi:Amt family ammonium transporter